MLSLLAVRKIQLGAEWGIKFPYSWLMWEPGVWQPSSGAGSPTLMGGKVGLNARPGQGDALCFELAGPRALKVGRSPECDVVLNDATVSREHLLLEPIALPDAWSVRLMPGASARLGTQPLGPLAQPLLPRHTLQLGDVSLTFYTSETFASRLDETVRLGRGG